MKNKFVRILSLILAMSVILSVTVFAEETASYPVEETTSQITEEPTTDGEEPSEPTEPENPENPTEPDAPDEPESPDTPDEPDNPDEPDDPDVPDEPHEPEPPKPTFEELPGDYVVGKMYICTQIVFLGHSWIYIESTFDGEIPVGCYTMQPYGSVSVGTFLFSRADGMGVYYNVERYCANEYGLKGQVWLGEDITKDDIETISREIKNWNYWDLYFNCTFFASKVWNSVSNKFMMPLMFPVFIQAQTKTQGGNSDVVMQNVEREDCYKQKKSGDKAYIVTVSDRTLNSRLGQFVFCQVFF